MRRDSGWSWTSLFTIKPSGKSSLPAVCTISDLEKGRFSIEILDPIIDYNINLMAMTLVGKFWVPGQTLILLGIFLNANGHLKVKWRSQLGQKGSTLR